MNRKNWWLRLIASAVHATALVVLFVLFGGERDGKADEKEPADEKPSRRTRRKMRRWQINLERRFDARLLGGQVVPAHVLDYLHEAKVAMATGEYGAARWNQRYVRAWLQHHP